MSRAPIFVTGNQYKADKLNQLLGLSLEHQSVHLDEIQAMNSEVVTEHKARQAFEILQKPVLVEDTTLEIAALGGLPGPFIKFFIEQSNGGEMICRMLDGFSDRSAVATSIFAYYDGATMELIRGDHGGRIAQEPRGTGGYGWDVVFEPDGFGGKTNAELSLEQYNTVYASAKPMKQLKKFLEES